MERYLKQKWGNGIEMDVDKNWVTFWEALSRSKEEDVLECEYSPYQNIVNNGDFTFMWEEAWEPVTLSGEFLGFKWRIKSS